MRWLAVAAFLALLGGCAPSRAYVEADRATYEIVAPSWRSYFQEDNGVTPERRESYEMLLKSWELRIRKAEEVDDGQ